MINHTIKVLLAEDHSLVRSSLQEILQTNSKYEIIASVASSEEALSALQNSIIVPELCILDIQMPDMDGIECTKAIRELYPQMKIILLTAFDHDTYMEEGAIARINGYLLKDMNVESFYRSVDMVMEGQFVAPLKLINNISSRLTQLRELEKNTTINDLSKLLSKHSSSLDDKELEIVRLIWQGWSNRMIAEDLYITEGTVKNYVSRMYRKLSINTRSELLQILAVKQE
ncbi:response regulator transcription factor [Paenibacillus sp. WQ 127069]|jgi:DNA-binding NarL/FixJ family response regulator|uniref:Response regulator transcription factor n=1 Tax=Paenibacillus baimaensis TaxID=2982185 RepID=A0ABT2UMU1_9BACL|nr:response regulator transcription factor [Paenibacillus sp. WQ 127069]MCU6795959.1 response regulator transcription factor [Paenibacillus sp. WQ 127069]